MAKFSEYPNNAVPEDSGILLYENAAADNSYYQTFAQLKAAIAASANTWTFVTANQSIIADNNYVTQGASRIELTLPTTAPQASVMHVVTDNANGFRIKQNAGQSTSFIEDVTTTGVTGYVDSLIAGTYIVIFCTSANTNFRITQMPVGSINLQ